MLIEEKLSEALPDICRRAGLKYRVFLQYIYTELQSGSWECPFLPRHVFCYSCNYSPVQTYCMRACLLVNAV